MFETAHGSAAPGWDTGWDTEPDPAGAREWDPIPAGLDHIEPGPVLAAWLTSIDISRISGHDRVVVLRAHDRLASHFQARRLEAMSAIAEYMHRIDDDVEQAELSAQAEIRLGLRLTRRSAETDLGLAQDVWVRYPRIGQACLSGHLDPRRARTIVNGVSHLPAPEADAIIDAVLPSASRLTTTQLAARIRKLCLDTDPQQAATRYAQAHAERRVVSRGNEDGTANLFGLNLAPNEVAEITNRIEGLARSLRHAGDVRTMDQLRADVLVDLLTGIIDPGQRPGGGVEIRVDLTTLAELADHAGELAGMGPVISEIARKVALQNRDGDWRFVATHPDTGIPTHVGTLRRRPTARQTRIIRALYPTCIHPGCRMPAHQCDLDHTTPWSESRSTCTCGLAPHCRHDHVIRHLPGWAYIRLDNGDHLWTTRLGHTYTTSGRPP